MVGWVAGELGLVGRRLVAAESATAELPSAVPVTVGSVARQAIARVMSAVVGLGVAESFVVRSGWVRPVVGMAW